VGLLFYCDLDTQTNADNVSFPTDNCFVSKRFIYDTPSTDPMAANQRNIKGRLSTAISYRLGAIASTTIYSYDEFGRVEWVIQKGLNPAKKITYTYDLQGNVTKKGYVDPANSKFCLYTFYTYDQAERLCKDRPFTPFEPLYGFLPPRTSPVPRPPRH